MKISTQILKTLIDIPENILELTNKHIIEIDNYEKLVDTSNLVVGHVISSKKHPNSDHLSLTKVDVGNGEILDIVCGASNVKEDISVIVAKVGAILPGNFLIKEAKIRGEESFGMICSLEELGLESKILEEKDKDGIYIFDNKLTPGTNALENLKLDGATIELGLTPNRSDLLSVIGYAKDLSVVLNKKFTYPNILINESNEENKYLANINVKEGLEYHTRHIKNVVIKDSPYWLKASLLESGITPINNVVDITNYILMLYGQPLHAFDANLLEGNNLYVDYSNNEKVVALDDETYKLNDNDLVIKDDKKVVAIAGIMGLNNSAINEFTKEVVLEAAIFDSEKVKQTSQRLNLRSDSQTRFERGINTDHTIKALNHAAMLIEELAGGSILKGINSKVTTKTEPKVINTNINIFNEKLGTNFSSEYIIDILNRLEFTTTLENDKLTVVVPNSRFDVSIAVDLVEEVGRIYGLDDIKNKPVYSYTKGGLSHTQKQIRKVRHFMANLGLNETINYSLIDENTHNLFKENDEEIKLLRPLTTDRMILRQNLVSSLYETYKYNLFRRNENISIFEIGKTFNKEEINTLGVLISSKYITNELTDENITSSYFVLKGILEQLFNYLNLELSIIKNKHHAFHPNIYAQIKTNNEVVGYIGQIHPKITKDDKLPNAYVFELDLLKLFKNMNEFKYMPISKYPTITRDLALVVSKDIESEEIITLIKQTLRKVIVDAKVFDVYEGDKIAKGFKSVAIRLTLNDNEKTLETKDIDQLVNRVVKRLEYEIKAQIRSV